MVQFKFSVAFTFIASTIAPLAVIALPLPAENIPVSQDHYASGTTQTTGLRLRIPTDEPPPATVNPKE